jgi:hypothetical protein
LQIFLVDGAGFIIAAAIANNVFDIATVHIQTETFRSGIVYQRANFDNFFFHCGKASQTVNFARGEPRAANNGVRDTDWQRLCQKMTDRFRFSPGAFFGCASHEKYKDIWTLGTTGKQERRGKSEKRTVTPRPFNGKRWGMPQKTVAPIVGHATPASADIRRGDGTCGKGKK